MTAPVFSVQPLESRRMLSAHSVQEFASALGSTPSSDAVPLKAELGLRADHQALDRTVTELRAALKELARLMEG